MNSKNIGDTTGNKWLVALRGESPMINFKRMMINFQVDNVKGLGERLDQFLSFQLNQYSRTRIQSWIKSGNVLVNGQFHKKNYLLNL